VTLLLAAFLLGPYPTLSLFMVAGVALLLLFVGIHNAWDAAVFVAFRRQTEESGD
jgi:hypothetical protein